MASELRITTLANLAATESVDTTYVINGSAKVWCNWDGTGTPSIRGGLNAASLTDNSTGMIQVNYTSSMADGNYSCNATGKYTGTGTGVGFNFRNVTTPLTTTSVQTHATPDYSQSTADNPYCCIAVHGDLA